MSKRLRLKSKHEKTVQRKYLPDDIWNHIFLNYCDFTSIVHSRILQLKYVKECTNGKDMTSAIRSSNLKNMKWIYQCSQGLF